MGGLIICKVSVGDDIHPADVDKYLDQKRDEVREAIEKNLKGDFSVIVTTDVIKDFQILSDVELANKGLQRIKRTPPKEPVKHLVRDDTGLEVPEDVQKLIDQRQKALMSGDDNLCVQIRDAIRNAGYEITEGKDGKIKCRNLWK